MNLYARTSHLYAEISGKTYAVSDGDLAVYVRALQGASREFDAATHRHFFAQVDTRYFSWRDGSFDDRRRLNLWNNDLVSISALTVDDNDDGTYELTLVEGTDYYVEPDNRLPNTPIASLYLLRSGTQLYSWPRPSRTVKIAGTWGYSEELEDTALTGTVATTTGTTLTASATAEVLIDVGETIKVEDEQMYVSAISTTSLTVVRGINGTTAAAHSAKAIYRRRYPEEVEAAVIARAGAQRWASQEGWAGQGEPSGEGRAAYAQWMAVVREFRVIPMSTRRSA